MRNDFISQIYFPNTEVYYNIYTEIRNQSLPLYLYGAGNLASRIIKKLEKENIVVNGMLIDSEFENDAINTEMETEIPVFPFSECIKIEKGNLIIAFAKGYRKKEQLEKLDCFHKVYVLDNPIEHHKKIESIYVRNNIQRLTDAYALFEDRQSKDNYCAFINSRINQSAEWVIRVSKRDWDEFNNDVMSTVEEEVFLDIGAYDGGSIKRFLKSNQMRAKKIIAIEPDKSNFEKLSNYINSIDEYDHELHQMGCWKEKTRLPFNNDGKCSRLDLDSDCLIDVDKVDNICGVEQRITLYNMGISIAEYEILQGSSELIKKWHPKLIIFMGSACEELWQIPAYIKELSQDYRIYLRFLTAMPSRLFLYAV